MKVLFASRYVDPNPIGGNKNVYLQMRALKDLFNIQVEALLWPKGDIWNGPVPAQSNIPKTQTFVQENLTYHLFNAPLSWNEMAGGNVIDNKSWGSAVAFGIEILKQIKPTIVHLQHRHGYWWILESAQKLGIPTIYTNHDWGMACLRTVLVQGNDKLCNGIVLPEKCGQCVYEGRKSVGRYNEMLVKSYFGRMLVEMAYKSPLHNKLKKNGVVKIPATQRAAINYKRAKNIIQKLDHCFTPSNFGATFFNQFGLDRTKITVMPWYHPKVEPIKKCMDGQLFTITYIGRVTPEKGVHCILEALEKLQDLPPIQLKIAGSNNSGYCQELQNKYPHNIGKHKVEWLNWVQVDTLLCSTDVTIIPSQWIDNTPLTLVESIAYRVPVIATNVPPISELVTDNKNGYLAEFGSINSLANAIHRAVDHQSEIRNGKLEFSSIPTLEEYMSCISNTYKLIIC